MNNKSFRLFIRVRKFNSRFYSSKRKEVERYLERQSNDLYSRRAREHSYRARSAFKLLQINERFRFIKPGLIVIDAGAAPGSWCQVLSELIFPDELASQSTKLLPIEIMARPMSIAGKQSKSRSDGLTQLPTHNPGYILGIDLQSMAPIENVDLLCNADITRPATQAEICRRLAGRRIDLLISDIAPNPTGDANTDHVRIIHLCRALLQFGTTMKPITGIEGEQPSPLLAEDGVFLCKVFDGPLRKEFANQLREKFATVTIVKPEASRGTSSETYLFASGLLRK